MTARKHAPDARHYVKASRAGQLKVADNRARAISRAHEQYAEELQCAPQDRSRPLWPHACSRCALVRTQYCPLSIVSSVDDSFFETRTESDQPRGSSGPLLSSRRAPLLAT